jgi:UDP-N-acetylmuramate--alanine ligase
VPTYGSGASGAAPEFVIEADEYDHMFLGLHPDVAVITNVEWDHPDCYPTPGAFRRAFMQFTDNVAREGVIIACADDPGAMLVHAYAPTRGPRWLLYGTAAAGAHATATGATATGATATGATGAHAGAQAAAGADLRAYNLQPRPGGGIAADLEWWHAPGGRLELQVAGVHNVRNALGALAAAVSCGVPIPAALAALGDYRGSARRFELKGEARGVTVIDDYAHHPTEVAATLAAARQRYPDRRLWAVFQPHTFSRTQRMLYQMGESFDAADEVIVLPIFAAREHDDGSVSSAELVAASPHPSIRHLAAFDAAVAFLADRVRPGDVVITLGAGDGYQVGEDLLQQLSAEATP